MMADSFPPRLDVATQSRSTSPLPYTERVAADEGIQYLPILDVTRGVVAGYQVELRPDTDPTTGEPLLDDPDGRRTAALIRAALDASTDMPVNTFLTIPVPVAVVASRRVLGALLSRPRLDGVVIDLVGSINAGPDADLAVAVDRYREAGALIAVGGHGSAQPELTGIVSLKPSFLRLSRDWVRGVDNSSSKRSALEVIGHLAAQLDAWIVAEGVCSAAELRVLAGLGVPLAQGPFIGAARPEWSEIEAGAARVLPRTPELDVDSPLRELVQPAYTATDPAVAVAVLAETAGFDVVVIVDEHGHPRTLVEHGTGDGWDTTDALSVSVATSPADAVQRALARPRTTRFTPLACTDNAGRFVGILRIERLMTHLAKD